jgi:tetratricopeptide (TPR) repeat protein
MSPEQALAKRVVVDHRSDIYSLGVSLYELLVLRPAFNGDDRQAVLRQIAFEEPRKPHQMNSRIPRDLETIVLKAIEKNPADRYSSAKDLADDLRRFLDDRAIHAKRPSIQQQITKWSRRHRILIASVATSFAVILIVCSAILGISNQRIRRESAATAAALAEKEKILSESRKIAKNANESSHRILRVVDSIFVNIDNKKLEELPELKALRDELERQWTDVIMEHPDNWRTWYSRGVWYKQLRQPEKAIADLSKAISLKPDEKSIWAVRGGAYDMMGEYDKAVADFTEAIKLDPKAPDLVDTYYKRALAYCLLRRFDEALADCDQALQINPNNYDVLTQRGRTNYFHKQFDAAVQDYTKAIEVADERQKLFVWDCFGVRALCHWQVGRYVEASQDFARAIELNPSDPAVLSNYAALLATAPRESARDGKRAVELATKACELTDYKNADFVNALSVAYAEVGDFVSAIKWSEAALELVPYIKDRGDHVTREEITKELESFRSGKPWREEVKHK